MIALTAITHRDKLIRARRRAHEQRMDIINTAMGLIHSEPEQKPFSQPNKWPPIQRGIIVFGSVEEALDYLTREDESDGKAEDSL